MSDNMGSLYEDLQRECIELRADLATARAERDALRDALAVIANRECADEEDAAGVADRCLRQINAALREPRT